MIALLATAALADPVALRSPVDGQLAVSVGAPALGAAWRLRSGEGGPQVAVGAGLRWPAGTVELGAGVALDRGPERGWGTAVGLAAGVLSGPALPIGASVTPWARVQRRGRVDGGLQLALPAAVGAGGVRLPVVAEPFIGGRLGEVHLLFQGGVGWIWSGGGGAGAAYAQGSVQLGFEL